MPTSPPSPDAAPTAADAPGRHPFPSLLRRCWFSLNQTFRRRIAHLGLTPDQFTILRWVEGHDREDLTQRELGKLMTSDPNTITSILKRMEASGFIRRTSHPEDRRANCIRSTEKGRALYHQARGHAYELQQAALSALPREKRSEFLDHLEVVAGAIEEMGS